MKWEAVAKSVIGVKHEKTQKPCQDYSDYDLKSNGQVVLGAISDGMGSAENSHIGSKLSVETTLKFLKEKKVWTLEPDEHKLRQIFEDLVRTVKSELEKKAKTEGYSIDKLDCTLIAFIATPKWLCAIQVGDGQIVVCDSSQNYQLLFQPDKGEYANVTTPITSESGLDKMRFCVKLTHYPFICAATDGIENMSLLKTEVWKPFDKFFHGLKESIASEKKSLKEKEEEVEDFLNHEEVKKRTDDDKTLLLCAYGNFSLTQKSSISYTPHTRDSSINSNPPKNIKREQFINNIHKKLDKIPEADKVFPEVDIKNKTLEITFSTRKRLEYTQHLVKRIQDIFAEDDSIKFPIEIKKVIIFNQDDITLECYFRGEFILKQKSVKLKPIRLLLLCFFGAITACGLSFLIINLISLLNQRQKQVLTEESSPTPTPTTSAIPTSLEDAHNIKRTTKSTKNTKK
jgi:serine/threonine protein phosphatase PrpC